MNKLLKGAFSFGFGTGITRILGFIREIVFAYLFGATYMMDAFRVAFRIPNLFRDLVAEGALTPAFVPVFSDYYKKDKDTQQRSHESELFLKQITGAMLLITIFISLIGVIFAPTLVKIISTGFKGEKFILTARLTRIMFPFIIFISLSALAMGVLNFFNHFFITGIAPSAYNIAIIIFGIILATKLNIYSIAIGAVIGGLLQLLVQYPTLKKENYLFLPNMKLNTIKKQSKIFLLMLPIVIGYSAEKINTIINTIIASFLETGVISWLEYGFRLIWIPVSAIGVALSNVALPFAAKELAENKKYEFINTIKQAAKYGILFSIFASLFLYFLATPICKIIYQRGKFTSYDTINTAMGIKFYSIGIIGITMKRILATFFYALKNTKIPMISSFITVGINAIIATTFVEIINFKAIPLAFSISNIANAIILWILLSKKIKS